MEIAMRERGGDRENEVRNMLKSATEKHEVALVENEAWRHESDSTIFRDVFP